MHTRGRGSRTVHLHPQEALLQHARDVQQSPAFAEVRRRYPLDDGQPIYALEHEPLAARGRRDQVEDAAIITLLLVSRRISRL
jgi:hypothetical protein